MYNVDSSGISPRDEPGTDTTGGVARVHTAYSQRWSGMFCV